MTLALKFENDDVVWISAVLSYDKSYSGRVTEHPVEDGTVVSDTLIREPVAYSLSGIISDADTNYEWTRYFSEVIGYDVINLKSFDPVVISETSPGLEKFLPEGISSLIPTKPPSILMDSSVDIKFAEKVRERLEKCFNSGESITLLDLENTTVNSSVKDLYIRKLDFRETPETGNSLEFSLQLHKVIKVVLQKAVVGAVALKSATNGGDNANGGAGGETPNDVGASGVSNQVKESTLHAAKASLSDAMSTLFGGGNYEP